MATKQRIHCELGPVLVNRTAVYKMCRALPGELGRRGFEVACSAIWAKVAAETAEPPQGERFYFEASKKMINAALRKPGLFNKARRFGGWAIKARHGGGLPLFMDPLYLLFFGNPDRGVCIVYDITTVSDPEWHHPGVGKLYGYAFRALANSRMHIVTSCQNTADQMRVNWGIAPSRLTVLPLGLFAFPKPPAESTATNCVAVAPGAAVAPEKKAPFLLFVGSLEPRKNVEGLIRAYAAADLFAQKGIRLRVIGSLPREDDPVLRLARGTPGVDLAGFATDEELGQAYHDCLAFVYPSFCEGFGLPLLEAMQTGSVCLSTMTGASPEIAGDAALYVNPYNPAEIAQTLRRVAGLSEAERAVLAARAKERAGLFGWKKFYDGLAEVLRNEAAAG
jgi:glycosyltransferase involved in cell wall biosynthesis